MSRSIGATPTVTEGHEVNRRLLFSSRSSGQAGSGRRSAGNFYGSTERMSPGGRRDPCTTPPYLVTSSRNRCPLGRRSTSSNVANNRSVDSHE